MLVSRSAVAALLVCCAAPRTFLLFGDAFVPPNTISSASVQSSVPSSLTGPAGNGAGAFSTADQSTLRPDGYAPAGMHQGINQCTTTSSGSSSNRNADASQLARKLTVLQMAANSESTAQDLASSEQRRRLLFSMLAATGSTLLPDPTNADGNNGMKANAAEEIKVLAAAEDWSNVNILKPPLDDRDYLAYIMDNGLKVILCSDPTSNDAGGAMDVHVGATSDPEGVRGLAHFNEHMLFLGTKPYPKEDSFESFLSTNGGSSNAYTASEDTVYHFTMDAESEQRFGEGLDRFGSFFTSPLFTEAATGRELNAIESENAKNLQSDNFRIYQLEKARQNQDHPHSKFFTGNKQTLLTDTKKAGLNLREELLKFYDKHYSANQMTLAVVGPQSIDKLQEMVQKAFGEIPNKQAPKPEDAWDGIVAPYSDSNIIPSFGHKLKVVPVQDLRQVAINWPIVYTNSDDRTNALLAKQSNYIAHLIGHEGPGSLLSYLKRKGWANSLSVGSESELSDYEVFEITVGLTKDGLVETDQIIESVYSYLGMLKARSIPSYVFSEVLQVEELGWRFAAKGGVDGYVTTLASSLQKYPPSLVVAGPRRLALSNSDASVITSSDPRTSFTSKDQLEFTKRLTNELLDQLTVDNSMVTLISKSFQGQTNKSEKWYGTDYSVERIPESTLARWKMPMRPQTLNVDFPRPNVFIPSEAGLRVKIPPPPKDRFEKRSFEDRMKPIEAPRIIRDDGPDGRWTVHYKADNRFGQPKAFIIFQLLNKEVYSSPKNAVMASLFEACVFDKLGEYAYDAGLAGLTYDVKVIPRGVRMAFGGYNDKLQQFAAYVSKKVSSDVRDVLPRNEKEFERYQDQIERGYAAFDVKQPYSHCAFYANLVTQPDKFTYDNRILRDAIQTISLEDLIEYSNRVWKSGKGLALVQGNVDENEALALVQSLDKTLGFNAIPVEEYPKQLEPLPLPPTNRTAPPNRVTFPEPNPSNSNSAVYVVLQSLSKEPRDHVLMELIGYILGEPFYEDLRTKQQLGYIVSSGVRANGKTRFFGFVVQSSVAPADKLTKAALKFLDNARGNVFDKISTADFAVFVKSLIARKTEPDKQLVQEVTRNWAEIAVDRLQFDRPQREAAALLDVTKEDMLEFWDRLYVQDGRRLLISESVPSVGAAKSAKPAMSGGYSPDNVLPVGVGVTLGIDDIKLYRTQMGSNSVP